MDVAATADAFVAIGTDSANPNDATTSILYLADGAARPRSRPSRTHGRPASPRARVGLPRSSRLTPRTTCSCPRTVERGQDLGTGHRRGRVDRGCRLGRQGWIVVGSSGKRAVVLRSADGVAWVEESLPASEPVDGILDVSAYRMIPGRWATLVLGLDRGPSCAEDDDWCDRCQAAWSWTTESGWMRLPRSKSAPRAGLRGRCDQCWRRWLPVSPRRQSSDFGRWLGVGAGHPVRRRGSSLANGAIVTDDRVVGEFGSLSGGDVLAGWFGSGLIRP